MKKIVALSALAVFPVLVSAQTALEGLIKNFVTVIIDPFVTLLFALALLYFFFGLMVLMVALSQGNDTTDGKRHMLWGLLGMVIMFSVGGIINLVSNSIGVDTTGSVQVEGGFE